MIQIENVWRRAREKNTKEALEEKQRAEAQQAAVTAQKNAQIAGVVDKYKALIINAISRQWILPDNVNNSLSSQFRILVLFVSNLKENL